MVKLCMHKEILHHSVTSVTNHNDVAYWNYTDGRQYVNSLGIMSHQLKISQISNSCESICFPQLCSFLWVAKANVVFERPETVFWHDCTKNKMTVIENSLSVRWRFIPCIPLKHINTSNKDSLHVCFWSTSIQTTHQFQLCLFFWPMCSCLIHWSCHCAANVL